MLENGFAGSDLLCSVCWARFAGWSLLSEIYFVAFIGLSVCWSGFAGLGFLGRVRWGRFAGSDLLGKVCWV